MLDLQPWSTCCYWTGSHIVELHKTGCTWSDVPLLQEICPLRHSSEEHSGQRWGNMQGKFHEKHKLLCSPSAFATCTHCTLLSSSHTHIVLRISDHDERPLHTLTSYTSQLHTPTMHVATGHPTMCAKLCHSCCIIICCAIDCWFWFIPRLIWWKLLRFSRRQSSCQMDSTWSHKLSKILCS